MEAYWSRGEDLEEPQVLARLAEQSGLTAAERAPPAALKEPLAEG